MRRSCSRIWLPTNNFYSNLSTKYAYALSTKLTDCWQHLMLANRTKKCTNSIFANRFSSFAKVKSVSNRPLRQARLNRTTTSPKVDLSKSSQRQILHSSVRWTPNFLATQRSFKLLGPALHPRHTSPLALAEIRKLEEFKEGSKRSLFTSVFSIINSKRQLDSFSRLKIFTEYLKLQRIDFTSMPFTRIFTPKSRRPRISAYLFVGLRRPPALTFSSPLKSFWRSFRKFQKLTHLTNLSQKKAPTSVHSAKHFLKVKSSKALPSLNRSRSSLNRNWMLSLILSRSPSLYTQSLKENAVYGDQTLPKLSLHQLRLPVRRKLGIFSSRLHVKPRSTNRLTYKKLRRSSNNMLKSYTSFWLRQTDSLRKRNPFSKRNSIFLKSRTTPSLSFRKSALSYNLLPAIRRYANLRSFSDTLSSVRGSQYLLLPALERTEYGNSLFLKSNLPNKVDLVLEPSYSPLFTLSPFGFLGYVLTSPAKIMDILRSTVNYSPTVNYLVFPDANAVKTSIFRRLNRQKFLSSARSSLFHRSTISGTSARFVRNSSYWPNALSGTSNNRTDITTATSLSFTKNWTVRKHSELTAPAVNKSPRIRRIRFKPGYYRIWRLARTSARELLGFTSRYQYRLTPKIQRQYYQVRAFKNVKLSLTVEFALLTCNFVPDHWSLKELLNSHNVFLNGTSCVNPKLRLFCSDFLQLVVGLQYYAMSRWLMSWSTQKKGRVSKTFYRKFKPSSFNKDIKLVRRLPDWFYDLQYTYTDIPKYFEVDYFTLSIFLIHDNISQERWLPNRADQMDYSSMNMYNWKYIT